MNTGTTLTGINWKYLRDEQGHPNLEIQDNEIPKAPKNYIIPILNAVRFPNIDDIGPQGTFTLRGSGYNRYHYNNEPSDRRLIVTAGKADLPALQYRSFYFNGCNSGLYYFEVFQRGVFIFTRGLVSSPRTTTAYVSGVIAGHSWARILRSLNELENKHLIYVFN
jgi:hypothetical protein